MRYLNRLNTTIKNRAEESTRLMPIFGVFGVINYPIFHIIWNLIHHNAFQHIEMRVIAAILCMGLILKDCWPLRIKHLLPIYWYITIIYCLPFFCTYIFLDNHASSSATLNSILATFMLIIIVDWLSFTFVTFIGITTAIIYYKINVGYITINPDELISTLTNMTWVILVCIFFSYSKDSQAKEKKRHLKQIHELNESLEQKVAERTLELQKALQVKTEFLNNMSHEIRTPVQGFMGISEGLDLHWSTYDDEQKHKYAHEIARNAKRLASLVVNLLDLTKFNKGKFHLVLSEFDFVQVVEDMIDEAKALYLNNKNIDISFERSNESFVVIGDIERIGQVLRNLFINAIKFSPNNSSILIKLELHEADIQFSIIDQGVGIPENELGSIFDSFVQSSRTKTQAGGIGLGLSICNRIIAAHHGKIWAENNNDKGAAFNFTIPITQIVENNTHQPLESLKINNVMIIDDEESMLAVMSIILSNHNYRVMQSSSGIEGLKLIKENYNNIDLILLDLMMPDMHGIEVLKAIKKDRLTKDIPVVIQSGTSNVNEKQKCFDLGAEAFLSKPYTGAILLEAISKIKKTVARA